MWEERNAVARPNCAHCSQRCLDGVSRRCYVRPKILMMISLATFRISALLMLSGMMLIGCASGAPVQEMSNARQAIKAARDAGAATTAPRTLNEAEALLDRAQDNLQRRAWAAARRDALAARDKAAEALAGRQPPDSRGSG